jgi:aspartate racemase
MRTIGLVGGTGWISSAEYYRIINEEINRRVGGLHFAKCILYSLNYGEINTLNNAGDHEGVFSMVTNASNRVAAAGADCIVLCANTLHMYADRLQQELAIPIVHIASATAEQIKKQNLSKVGLLGTQPTMEKDFYKARLNRENIDVLVPELRDREFVHYTIMNELLKGIFKRKSKERFLSMILDLQSRGAEGIILGCTEIPLLIEPEDVTMPLFNTTIIHSLAAVEFAVGEGGLEHEMG